MKKRILSFLLAAACMGSLAVGSAAGAETVHTEFWKSTGYIRFDGVPMWFLNEQGHLVDPIQYNGTVYIPVRTAGEWMGANVEWDQDTQTVELTTGGEQVFYRVNSVEDPLNDEESEQKLKDRLNGFDITIRPDITIKIDGEVQEFRNVLGEPVYPVVFRGSVFLPVRSIGELLGKKVLWIPQKDLPGEGQHTGSSVWDKWDYELFHSEPEYTTQESIIQIYDQPTEEELAAAEAYIDQVKALYLEHVEELQKFLTAETMDQETTLAEMERLASYGPKLRAVPSPEVDFLEREVWLLQFHSSMIDEYRLGFYVESVRRGTETHESLKQNNKLGDWCCSTLVTLRFWDIATMEALVEGMRGN